VEEEEEAVTAETAVVEVEVVVEVAEHLVVSFRSSVTPPKVKTPRSRRSRTPYIRRVRSHLILEA
jgi:hypothetical protein